MNKSKIVMTALTFLLVLAPALQVKASNGVTGLDHFEFNTIPSGQTEGVPFWITVTAKDVYGYTVPDYAGTNTLSVSVGTISPAFTTAFTNGVWYGEVTVSTRGDNVRIFTSGNGKSGTSNTFEVYKGEPKVVEYFEFDIIGSPQIAGMSFLISITAKDVDGDTVTSYTGMNTLSASVGTITPSSIAFSNGNWMERVTLSQDGAGVYILTTGQGKSGTSNTFRVDPNRGFLIVLIVVAAIIAIVLVVAVIGYKKVLRRPKRPTALAQYPRSSTPT